MNKPTAFFKSFLPFVFFMALNLIVSVVTTIAFTMRQVLTGAMDTDIITYMDGLAEDATYIQITSILFSVIVLILFTIWYRRVFVRPLQNKTRKYWSGISFQVIIALIFLGFGLQYVAQLLVGGIAMVFPQLMENYNQLLESVGYGSMSWMLALYSLILAPTCEELAFRGLTMRFSRQWLPFWAANIFQAALFGIMHLNVIQGLYAFAIGLFLGWVCQKGHSLKYSIILHILFNILGTVCIDFFGLTLSINAVLFIGLGIVLTIFAMWIFQREFSEKNRRRHQQAVEE